MGQGYGRELYVGIGEESTYRTPVVGSKWFEVESEGIKCKPNPRVPANVLGSLSLKRTVRQKTAGGGPFMAPMSWNGFEKLLKHAFGLGSVSTSGANPYTHTFTLKSALEVGLTVLSNRDAANVGAGSMFQYAGCHISKLKLSYVENEPLKIEPTIIVGDVAVVAIQAPTFPAWDPIEYGMMTVANMDQDGAATAMKILSWSLEMDNKLESKHYLTSHLSQGVHRVDRRSVMFESEIEFESLAIYNAYKTATEHDYRWKWMKDPLVDTVNTFQLDAPKAFIEEGEPEVSGPGPIRIALKGTAEMNAADNDELVAVLKNSTVGPI